MTASGDIDVIDFDLDGLHPSYERAVLDVIRGLDLDYPMDAVRRVEVYRPAGDDESMGCSSAAGVISLNGRWFSRPINELREAAREDDQVILATGAPPIGYHGGMEEPIHVLTHEFAHCLADVLPGWREFAEPHWRASCADPAACRPPSGYALASADEFFADAFAAMRLGYPSEAGRLLREFLAERERT